MQHEDLMAESEDLGITGVAAGEQPSQPSQHEPSKHSEQRPEGTLRGAGAARERWADEYSAPSRSPSTTETIRSSR